MISQIDKRLLSNTFNTEPLWNFWFYLNPLEQEEKEEIFKILTKEINYAYKDYHRNLFDLAESYTKIYLILINN